jgi:hypothetical protein
MIQESKKKASSQANQQLQVNLQYKPNADGKYMIE